MQSNFNLFSILFVLLLIFQQQTCYAEPYNNHEEKVIICGVAKNIAHAIHHMMQKIEQLGACFKDYRVIIYENNSTDNTQQILQEWQYNNSKVMVTCERLNDEQLSQRTIAHALRDKAPNRMELIAYGRNFVLKKAMEAQYDDFNFIIMTDLDFPYGRGWDVSGVLSSFTLTTPWDALTANGIDSYTNNYYDRYAYRDEQFPLGPELIGEEFWHGLARYPIKFAQESPLKKVYSAFGGIGVYKREVLQNCHYSGYITDDFKTFMGNIINNEIAKNNWQYLLYQQIIGSREIQLPVLFQANSGYDSPVVCEHSTLHAQMIFNGHDNIYVNPRMRCCY